MPTTPPYARTKLRFYSFTNFYLNSLSQGIQPGHVIGRMAHFYRKRTTPEAELFYDWCDEETGTNETMICLNGGMAADVAEAYFKFEPILHKAGIPAMIFYEEPRALGMGTGERTQFPTSWACILPEALYDARYEPDVMNPSKDQYLFGKGEPHETGIIGSDSPLQIVAINSPGAKLKEYPDYDAFGMFEFLKYKARCPLAR